MISFSGITRTQLFLTENTILKVKYKKGGILVYNFDNSDASGPKINHFHKRNFDKNRRILTS